MTCNVEIVSDTSNEVVATVDGSDPRIPDYPEPAVLAWEHSVWIDPPVGAEWIWATNPTLEADAEKEVQYHFENTFDWYGPINEADVEFAVASDNSVEVYLNGNYIGGYSGEEGYDQLTSVSIDSSYVNQGENVVKFEVTNWDPDWNSDSYWDENPGGLAYKLTIDGDCESTYFRQHCQLWNLKDLDEEDKFFNFNDVKPGDWGTNVISYHVYDNDAHVCMIIDENTELESEQKNLGEGLEFFMWNDKNENGKYNPGQGEADLFGPELLTLSELRVALGEIEATTTNYVGLAWCAGKMTLEGEYGNKIVCDGAEMGNEYQGSTMMADLIFYAVQSRNNQDFDCEDAVWEDLQ
jgi:hypothetical protein